MAYPNEKKKIWDSRNTIQLQTIILHLYKLCYAPRNICTRIFVQEENWCINRKFNLVMHIGCILIANKLCSTFLDHQFQNEKCIYRMGTCEESSNKEFFNCFNEWLFLIINLT